LNYPPEQINERGNRNLSNLINSGFSCISLTLAPATWKKLMRMGFLNYGNWCKSTEQALYSSVPRLSIQFRRPLIFNGEDPGLQEFNVLDEQGWLNNSLRELNTLQSNNWIFELLHKESSSSYFYSYPSLEEFAVNNTTIVDLGWVMPNWNFTYNGKYSILSGLEPKFLKSDQEGDPSFVSSLDEDYVWVNQMVKYYKYGYAKATDFFNEEIRGARIRREDAIKFVEKYDGECSDELIESFCKYIDITSDKFWSTVHEFTNYSLFKITKDSPRPVPIFQVGGNQ